MDTQVAHANQRPHTYPPRAAALSQAATPLGKGRALVMRVKVTLLSVGILLIPALALAQGAKPAATNPPARHVIVMPDQLVWKPLMPGSEISVVSGDPDKKGGVYVVRIRTKGELNVPPHWHMTDEHITVLEGSFWMAQGEQYDAAKLKELKVGAHSMVPAEMRHFGLHGAGNVIEVFGEAPFVVTFVNSEDDTRRVKGK
ncbi:MAG: cupin domain-containing protein [Nitrospira sp.]|nr:cupin domain-containing protein [Nitrospira sp.]